MTHTPTHHPRQPDAQPADGTSFTTAVAVVVTTLGDAAGLREMDESAVRERLRLLRRLEGATTAAIATTVAALDRLGGVSADGAPSKAEWLKANTGRSGRQAAQLARLADNLDELPRTAAALAHGRLGTDAADTIVRASRDGRLGTPDQVEDQLLDLATSTTPDDLRTQVRRRQHRVDGAALLRDERRQHALRRLSVTRHGGDGMWDVHGRLSGEIGSRLRTALDAFDHRDPPDTPPLRRRRPDQRLADALGHLVDTVLDRGLGPATGGMARPHLSVVVDLPTIVTDLTQPDALGPDVDSPDAPDDPVSPDDPTWADLPPGTTSWGDVLSPQAVRRLLCNASVSRIVMAGQSQVLDVGRATRDWSEPQRRAINARDGSCRGPNCSRPISWTQVHHVQWWRHGGATAVDNGIAVCHHCHRLVHDLGWGLRLDPTTAVATWTSPTGEVTVTGPHHRDVGTISQSLATPCDADPAVLQPPAVQLPGPEPPLTRPVHAGPRSSASVVRPFEWPSVPP